MAIFGRRRASSNPRPSTTSTSSAATLAASQAFLANRASNTNLSNAAATAALRAHTPNPTPVGQIQTKRMQRRGSVTSQTSAPDGKSFRPGGLQRRDSSGSMTERTFRSPSPGISQDHRERPASSHGPYPRHDQNDAPPVPALPKDYVAPPQKVNTASQRPTSLEPPHRISSPPPKQAGGRVMSLNRESLVETPISKKVKPKKTPESTEDLERNANRSPVNFSRPMSPENALPKSPLASGRVRSPPPTTSPPVTPLPPDEGQRQEVASPQNNTPATAPKKKKKKKVVTESSAEGNILAKPHDGQLPPTMTDMPRQQSLLSTASSPGRPSSPGPEVSGNVALVKTTTKKKKKKKIVQNGESKIGGESFGAAYPSDTDSVVSERSSTTDRPKYPTTRATGLLAKQPSIVREDRAGEEEAEDVAQGGESKSLIKSSHNAVADSSATSIRRGIKGRQHGRSASQQATSQEPKLDVPGVVRQASLSPGRTAHFSNQPVNEGKKHQPPARSVSPAKSAMKSSPSRGHSPMVITRGGLAPSEASDSNSQYSDDGSKFSKKKKSARVSFDEEPVVVGRAASPPSNPVSPNIVSPQNKSAKTRSWLDLVQEQSQKSLESSLDNGSAIKPTPALPSFGSVRNRESKSIEEVATQVDSSNDRSQDARTKLDASTDSAIGSLIAADSSRRNSQQSGQLPTKSSSGDPLPPEVTSVEGSGYHSEDGDIVNEGDEKFQKRPAGAANAMPTSEKTPSSAPSSDVVEDSISQVPHIAVQPATPALEAAATNRNSWLHMPGGFPPQKESESEPTSTSGQVEHRTTVVENAKPKSENTAGVADSAPPDAREPTEDLSVDELEESDAGSIYSDAAEDQSDLEGDGFGSINAIVESPISPTSGLPHDSPPASPLRDVSEIYNQPGPAKINEKEASEPISPGGWDRAQAYWSGLSQTQKQQLEQAAIPGAIDEPVIRNRSMRGADAVNKKKKKKRVKKVQPQPLGEGNTLQSNLTPPQSQEIRSSSPQDAPASHLRSSMRDEAPKSALKKSNKRNSLNPPSLPETALPKKTRPMSAAATVDYSKNVQLSSPKSAKVASIATPASSGVPIPARQQKHFPVAKSKTHQDNSDSDSSFKKIRPKSVDGQRYTMRRSMRSQSSQGGATRADSLVVRTASPPATNMRRAFSQPRSNGTTGLRTSMRGSEDSSKQARTSLRTSIESGKAGRTKSPSRFSFLGSSKTKLAPTEPSVTSGFSSRFADSSDEEGLPAMTRSRFADSSDDEGSAGLTPVRGIPRRTNEGDSTELDDSSEEKEPSPTKAQSTANGSSKVRNSPAPGSEGATLAKGSVRTTPSVDPVVPKVDTNFQATKPADKEKKKRSFFGSLSGRKHDSSSIAPKSELQSLTKGDPAPNGKGADPLAVDRSKASGRVLGPSSLTADPVGMPKIDTSLQAGSQTSIPQNNPKSPKLQRRVTPKRITSANDISWPLSQSAVDPVETPARPSTSDGTAVPKIDPKPGPSLVLRHSVQAPTKGSGMSGATLPSPDPNTKKKKKFSMLRKAFGL